MDQLQDNEYIRVTHEKLMCFLRVLDGIFQLRGCKDSNLCKIIINNNVAPVYLITSYMCVIIPYMIKHLGRKFCTSYTKLNMYGKLLQLSIFSIQIIIGRLVNRFRVTCKLL